MGIRLPIKTKKFLPKVRKPKLNSPGDFIRYHRELMGMSKAELGRHVDIPGNASQYLYAIENDQQLPSLKLIPLFAKVLRVHTLDLRVLCAEHEMDKIREKYGIEKMVTAYRNAGE